MLNLFQHPSSCMSEALRLSATSATEGSAPNEKWTLKQVQGDDPNERGDYTTV